MAEDLQAEKEQGRNIILEKKVTAYFVEFFEKQTYKIFKINSSVKNDMKYLIFLC